MGKASMCLIQMTINKDSKANSEEYMKSKTNLTLRCPSYAVPMPLWASIPNLPFVWSGATGHTEGALSAQVTWQEKLQTIRRDGGHRHWVLQSILSIRHPGIGAHLINQCERKGSPLFYSKLEWLFLQWNTKGKILKGYTGYLYAFLWINKVVRVWSSRKLKMSYSLLSYSHITPSFHFSCGVSSPSQAQPWRRSPTMREVHWLHFVGMVKDFTINWCALGCGAENISNVIKPFP